MQVEQDNRGNRAPVPGYKDRGRQLNHLRTAAIVGMEDIQHCPGRLMHERKAGFSTFAGKSNAGACAEGGLRGRRLERA